MTVVHALPSHGDVFFDARDDGRTLRVGWHVDQEVVVLSTWRHGSCVASCHVDRKDVPALVAELVQGLAATPERAWTDPVYVEFSRETSMRPSLLDRSRRTLRRLVGGPTSAANPESPVTVVQSP